MKKNLIFFFLLLLKGVLLVSFLTAGEGEPKGLHDAWDQLLKKHVVDGVVDYQGINGDNVLFSSYLQRVAQVDLASFSREERLAFWINAYNAFTVKLILLHYPLKSIRDISGPWSKKIWVAAGKTVSLDDIEHQILRKQFKEPRIHFTIVCASIGCPNLLSFAFRGDQIEKQLTVAAGGFFGSMKHFYLEGGGAKLKIHISKIFKWFGDDFGDTKEKRVAFIQRYVNAEAGEKLKHATAIGFDYLDYNWNLNGK